MPGCRRARAARRVHRRARARAGAARAVHVLRRGAGRRAGRAGGDRAQRSARRRSRCSRSAIPRARRPRRRSRCASVFGARRGARGARRALSAVSLSRRRRSRSDHAEVDAGRRGDRRDAGLGERDDPRDAAEPDQQAERRDAEQRDRRARPGPGSSRPASIAVGAARARGATRPAKSRWNGLPAGPSSGARAEQHRQHRDHPGQAEHERGRAITTATAPWTARSARASTGFGPSSHAATRYVTSDIWPQPMARRVRTHYSENVAIWLRCVFKLPRDGGVTRARVRQLGRSARDHRSRRRRPLPRSAPCSRLRQLRRRRGARRRSGRATWTSASSRRTRVVRGSGVDVARSRERTRRRRLWKLFIWLAPIVHLHLLPDRRRRTRSGSACRSMTPTQASIFMPIGLIVLLGVVIIVPMMSAGKSPHVRYDPSEIDVTIDDVVGIGPVQRRGRQDAQPVPRLPDVPRAHGWQPAQGDPVRRAARNRQDVHGQGDGARSRRAVPVRVVDRVPVDVLRPDRPQDPQLLQGAAQGGARRGWRDRVHRGDRRDRRRAQRHAQHAARQRTLARRACRSSAAPRAKASPVSSTSC